MNVRAKILLAPLVAVGLMVLLGIVAFTGIRSMESRLDELASVSMRKLVDTGEVRDAVQRVNTDVFKLFTWISNYDAARIAKEAKAIDSRLETIVARIESLSRSDTREEEAKLLKAAGEGLARFRKTTANAIDMATTDVTSGAGMMMAAATHYNEMARQLDQMVELQKKEAADDLALSQQNATRSVVLSLVLVGVAIGASLFIAWRVTASVVGQLGGMADMCTRIQSSLDFTGRIPVSGSDEVARTAAAFNGLLERLQTNLRELSEHTASVDHAAQELAESTGKISTATLRQSAAASTMAASIEEMAASIQQVADRAGEANALSASSGEQAQRGEAVIGKTVTDINSIAETVGMASDRLSQLEQQSQQVSQVVGVIKEIADQTNLLALNAAIEAARAGEQGRGFAVVADEVRKLAERTTVSTQEIDSTIAQMQTSAKSAVQDILAVVEKVGAGVAGAEEASQTIQAIGMSSRNTVAMVADISHAIREQSAASTNITQQVEEIARMSEQNSHASDNASATASGLAGLAEKMRAVVAQYRI